MRHMADSNKKAATSELSIPVILGMAIVVAATLGLAIFLTVLYIRRRKQKSAHDLEKAPRQIQVLPETAQKLVYDPTTEQSSGPIRLTAKRNLTPSIILPMPLSTAVKGSWRPILETFELPPSSIDLVWHPQSKATSTQAQPFTPSVPKPQTSSPRTSLPRASILSPPSRIPLSLGSLIVPTPGGMEPRKVRSEFLPRLPDELLVSIGEEVALIQIFDDGWCIVGRKSPFYAPAPTELNQTLGRGLSVDDVEVGAVPSWVFEKRANGSPKRPPRKSSLVVSLKETR